MVKVLQHSDITDIKAQNVTDCYSAVLLLLKIRIFHTKTLQILQWQKAHILFLSYSKHKAVENYLKKENVISEFGSLDH